MWSTLKHCFQKAVRLILGLERGLAEAQPLMTAITAALGGADGTRMVTVERLCIAILGEVLAAVADLETDQMSAAVTLAAPTVGNVRQLASLLRREQAGKR